MTHWNMLIFTDHATHSSKNSLYKLAGALANHPVAGRIAIASRSNPANYGFFYKNKLQSLAAYPLESAISFEDANKLLMEETVPVNLDEFDVILLRLPRPIPDGFFEFLEANFPENRIVNRPSGIKLTGSKKFLLEFQDICPPMKLCQSMEDIRSFQHRFPIVLKPLESYGGQGIVKVANDQVSDGEKTTTLDKYVPTLEKQFKLGGYLGMKFLKNVDQGDKRVVVIDGEIVGGALRKPPEGSWICNAARGGSSSYIEADKTEKSMAARIHEKVSPHGIGIFGMDTLVGDDGIRKLSELNTLSIGGIAPMEESSGKPLVKKAANLLWHYITKG